MSKLSGGQIAGGNPTRGRVANDYYATPPSTTRAILDEVELVGSIYEPACGEGHISEVLKEYYPDSKIVSTDLIDRGYGMGGIDFLEDEYVEEVDNVITNPPFKYAKEFIYKALELANDKVVMLARVQLLESVARKKMFEETPLKYVYVFSGRQSTWRNGEQFDAEGKPWASTMALAWFIWEQGYEGEPVVRWL